MSCNKWCSKKVGAKSMSDLVTFLMFCTDIPLDFHESILVVPLKYLMYFLAGTNTKEFWKSPKEKCFAPLRILNLFIKPFVTSFIDIALTFFVSSFNLFLFYVTFLVYYQNLFFLRN